MDKDLNELEQLAEGTHADLQEKPKKSPIKELNGGPDDFKENGVEPIGKESIDTLTQVSGPTNASSQNTLSDPLTLTAKQP